MASINFNLSKKSAQKYLIFAIVFDRTIEKYKLKKSTGHFITSPDHWDKKKQRVKHSAPMSGIINGRLIEMETIFNNYVKDRMMYNLPFKGAEVLEALGGSYKDQSNPAKYLVNAFDTYMKDFKKRIGLGAISHYNSLKGEIEQFEKLRNKKVKLIDVDLDLYTELIEFLIDHRDNVNTTLNRKIRRIKTVLNHASKAKGYKVNPQYDISINLPEVAAARVPLTEEEVDALWDYRTTDLEMKAICDAFLTSIFTGLRYSDLLQLEDLHFFKHGEIDYINIRMEKSPDNPLTVPVPWFVMDRLRPYRGNGKLFRFHENSYSNRLLKEIAQICKLRREVQQITVQGAETILETKYLFQAISFHFGRYTYTRLLDNGGLQATYVQGNLGHADLKTTMRYMFSEDVKRMKETVDILNRMKDREVV